MCVLERSNLFIVSRACVGSSSRLATFFHGLGRNLIKTAMLNTIISVNLTASTAQLNEVIKTAMLNTIIPVNLTASTSRLNEVIKTSTLTSIPSDNLTASADRGVNRVQPHRFRRC